MDAIYRSLAPLQFHNHLICMSLLLPPALVTSHNRITQSPPFLNNIYKEDKVQRTLNEFPFPHAILSSGGHETLSYA